MPTDYAGDDTSFPATVPIPADGEAIAERNCAPAWKKCADRSAYLHRVRPRIYTWATASGSPFWTYTNDGSIQTTEAALGLVDVPDCAVGDKILVSALFTVACNTGGEAFTFWIDALEGSSQDHVPGASWTAFTGINGEAFSSQTLPIAISSVWTVAEAGTTRFTIAGQAPGFGGGESLAIYPGFNIVAIRLPQ